MVAVARGSLAGGGSGGRAHPGGAGPAGPARPGHPRPAAQCAAGGPPHPQRPSLPHRPSPLDGGQVLPCLWISVCGFAPEQDCSGQPYLHCMVPHLCCQLLMLLGLLKGYQA